MFADAGPAMSGWPPGGVAVPPKATGICAADPRSVLSPAGRTGAVVPNQLPLKFFRFVVPGTGSAPPVCRSTTCPYQLPAIALFVNVEFSAFCGGVPVVLAARNSTPTVQLLVILFCETERFA